MKIDPFLEPNIEATDSDKQILDSKTGLIGFFVCSFDITRGLQILFSSPRKLEKNQNELDILKTHYIWKIEKIPLRIDLKFTEFTYAAFQIYYPKEEEIIATVEKPLYGIIIKILRESKPIPPQKLLDFKLKIEKEVGNSLKILSKRKILESNPVKREKYKKLSEEANHIYIHLEDMWIEFKKQIMDLYEYQDMESKKVNNTSLVSKDGSFWAKSLIKKKISMRTISTKENPNKILVMLVNQNETLRDVIIHVSKTMELFSETIWVQELPEWPMKEELILEFTKSDFDENYLIKISSRKTTVDIKSLEIKAGI
ncbi:MAG: hypothetical protein ACFFAU_03715 [Candidatus Hodarchaeota archaeon]